MHVQLNIKTELNIKSVADLQTLMLVTASLIRKINKSELVLKLHVDSKIVDKYLNGYVKPKVVKILNNRCMT
jgi:hypothetical protein